MTALAQRMVQVESRIWIAFGDDHWTKSTLALYSLTADSTLWRTPTLETSLLRCLPLVRAFWLHPTNAQQRLDTIAHRFLKWAKGDTSRCNDTCIHSKHAHALAMGRMGQSDSTQRTNILALA